MPTRSPRRVEQLYFLFCREPTVRSTGILERRCDAPTRGSVDYPSTRGNTRECRVTRHFSRKSSIVSFVRGALPNYKTCIYMSQIVQYNPNKSKTATWAHKQYSSYIPTMNPTISNSYKSSNIFFTLTQYIY